MKLRCFVSCELLRVLSYLWRIWFSVDEFKGIGCARIVSINLVIIIVHFIFFHLVQKFVHTRPRFILKSSFVRSIIRILFIVLIYDLLNSTFQHLLRRQRSLKSLLFPWLTSHGSRSDYSVESVTFLRHVLKILPTSFDETIPFASLLIHSYRII